MFKKIFTLIIVALIILVPFTCIAETVSSGVMDDASQKADRTKKEGDKVVEKAAKNFTIDADPDKELIDIDNKDGGSSADQSLTDIGKGTYSFAWRVLIEFQRNSFPVCLIGIIIGALITFILGPRNMVRKKLGVSLMFGFLSFWVVAQVAPVVFWLLIQ
ncbi:MAG: hypothetical protein ACM3UU_02250 [Ignavibacteriales bacterium]